MKEWDKTPEKELTEVEIRNLANRVQGNYHNDVQRSWNNNGQREWEVRSSNKDLKNIKKNQR